MDKLCKNTMHINKLSSSLCHQLRNIQNIKGKFDFEAAKPVGQALILSKLDYCSSLLIGTPECHLSHLQHIQISYMIAYLIHCCKMGTAPQYLLPRATHNHSLRSSNSGNLQSAKWRTSLPEEGSFSAIGPKVWNSLPCNVRTEKLSKGFRKSLKTHLFGQSYPT